MSARVVIVAAALFLTGCAGSQSHLRILETNGAVRVMAVQADDHDYVVAILNTVDFGHNPDRKEHRDRVAMQLMQHQCPRAKIVGEDVIVTGTYLGGRESRTYQIRVLCNPDAAA